MVLPSLKCFAHLGKVRVPVIDPGYRAQRTGDMAENVLDGKCIREPVLGAHGRERPAEIVEDPVRHSGEFVEALLVLAPPTERCSESGREHILGGARDELEIVSEEVRQDELNFVLTVLSWNGDEVIGNFSPAYVRCLVLAQRHVNEEKAEVPERRREVLSDLVDCGEFSRSEHAIARNDWSRSLQRLARARW